ncbi:MAG: hypothetical protein K6L75_07460 [Cellvibrionaceae bacterium]
MSNKDEGSRKISLNDANFRRFRLGLSIFFTGMIFLYASNQLLEPSLKQEIVSLICIIILSAGFILAIVSETRFVLTRIIQFFNSK